MCEKCSGCDTESLCTKGTILIWSVYCILYMTAPIIIIFELPASFLLMEHWTVCVCVSVSALYVTFCLGNTINWSEVTSMCVRDTERKREGENKEKIKPLKSLKAYSYCNCFFCGYKLFTVSRDFIVVQIQKCLPPPM